MGTQILALEHVVGGELAVESAKAELDTYNAASQTTCTAFGRLICNLFFFFLRRIGVLLYGTFNGLSRYISCLVVNFVIYFVSMLSQFCFRVLLCTFLGSPGLVQNFAR